MYQQFLVGERYLKKQNQQKGKPSNPGDATALKLMWNRYFFGLTLKKYKLHTSPHFQNMPKNYLLT